MLLVALVHGRLNNDDSTTIIRMPQVYVKKELYDEIVKTGNEASVFANNAIKVALQRQKGR
jgi:hypothetical protein